MYLANKVLRLGFSEVNNVHKFGACINRNIRVLKKYNIQWERPPRVTAIETTQSGDLGIDVKVEPTETILDYKRSNELKDAPDVVKKMFTVEFNKQKEWRNLKKLRMVELVKRHRLDKSSVETKIARMTSEIYDLQECLKKYPRQIPIKVFLNELVDRRRRYLTLLRTWDYRRFEWLLNRLNLVYKPVPEKLGMVPRKESIRRITQEYCDKIVKHKLDAYKKELEAQQLDFYREKIDMLQYIFATEQKHGIKPTISEEEIEEAKQHLEKLQNEIDSSKASKTNDKHPTSIFQ